MLYAQTSAHSQKQIRPLPSRSLSLLTKEAVFVIAGQIVTAFGGLLLTRTLTDTLDPGTYGSLSLLLTAAAFANQLVFGGLSIGIARFYPLAQAGSAAFTGYSCASTRLLTLAILLTLFLPISISTIVPQSTQSQWESFILPISILAAFMGSNSTINAVNNAARKRADVALASASESILRILLCTILIRHFTADAGVALIGYISATALVCTSQLLLLLHRNNFLPKRACDSVARREWMQQIWGFSWPFSIWGLFTSIHLASDRIALARYADTETVARYAVLYQLAYMPTIIVTNFLVTFFSPILFQAAAVSSNTPRQRSARRTSYLLAALSVLITLAIAFTAACGHRQIFNCAVADTYADASFLLPWMVIAAGITSTGQMFCLQLMAEFRTSALLLVKIITALGGIGMQWAGAKYFGIQGVVGAQVFFSLFFCFWVAYLQTNESGPKFRAGVAT